VVVADIDHFKKVNDTFGHLLGDQVIRAAADALQNGIKGRDIAARWGGEEFVILLPETSGQGAAVLAEQLRTAFAKTRIRRAGNTDVAGTVTISMGIAEIQSTEETVEQAIGRADKALYQAKGDGRNCVRVAA
jgi:diguanylate cyclase